YWYPYFDQFTLVVFGDRSHVVVPLFAPVCVCPADFVGRPLASIGQKAPSGINQTKKLRLLAEEGVHFDTEGKLITSTTPTTTHTPFTTAATATTSTTSTATAVKKACRKEVAGAGHVWFDGASSLDSDLDGAQERLKIIMESGKSKKV
ncbi:hypothetical protein LTS06_012485, partial [Exophiala xenobiotica]